MCLELWRGGFAFCKFELSKNDGNSEQARERISVRSRVRLEKTWKNGHEVELKSDWRSFTAGTYLASGTRLTTICGARQPCSQIHNGSHGGLEQDAAALAQPTAERRARFDQRASDDPVDDGMMVPSWEGNFVGSTTFFKHPNTGNVTECATTLEQMEFRKSA